MAGLFTLWDSPYFCDICFYLVVVDPRHSKKTLQFTSQTAQDRFSEVIIELRDIKKDLNDSDRKRDQQDKDKPNNFPEEKIGCNAILRDYYVEHLCVVINVL